MKLEMDHVQDDTRPRHLLSIVTTPFERRWRWMSTFLLAFTLLQSPPVQSFSPNVTRTGHRRAVASSSHSMGTHDEQENKKKIVFLRHGRTYMNELIDGVHYGQPGFTDIFPASEQPKYHDSPLSPTGWEQVESLHDRIQQQQQAGKDEQTCSESSNTGTTAVEVSSGYDYSFLEDMELIVCSPLIRALQTMDRGFYQAGNLGERQPRVPVIASPLAAERVYMVSDWGKPTSELKELFPQVDFNSEFEGVGPDEVWYFVPSPDEREQYQEWRPHGQGQVYAGLGEPQQQFSQRMSDLYWWLDSRKEQTIAVVCHAGVIDWFLQEIVDNCEVRVVPFAELKPRDLMQAKT